MRSKLAAREGKALCETCGAADFDGRWLPNNGQTFP